jgi:hypothetical protein
MGMTWLSLPIAISAQERTADAWAVIAAALILLGAYAALTAASHSFYKATKRRKVFMEASGAFIACVGAFAAFVAAIEVFGFAPGLLGIAERVVLAFVMVGIGLIIGFPFAARAKKHGDKPGAEAQRNGTNGGPVRGCLGLLARALFGVVMIDVFLRVAFHVIRVSRAAQERRNERPGKDHGGGEHVRHFPKGRQVAGEHDVGDEVQKHEDRIDFPRDAHKMRATPAGRR